MVDFKATTWDFPDPFIRERQVHPNETDRLGHANNTAYLHWMEEISWEHISPLGMSWEVHETLGKAMAITRTEVDYLASAYAGDALYVGTWIMACDERLTSERRFQIVRTSDSKTLLRAYCRYACIDIRSGRPSRMPQAFIECHRVAMRWREKGV